MLVRAGGGVRTVCSGTFLFFLLILEKCIFKSLAHSPASPEPELPLDCGV